VGAWVTELSAFESQLGRQWLWALLSSSGLTVASSFFDLLVPLHQFVRLPIQ
jgi:hypothetical protein